MSQKDLNPSSYLVNEKPSAIKCECLQKEATRGAMLWVLPVDTASVSLFAWDHYSAASCSSVHLLYQLTCKMFYTLKKQQHPLRSCINHFGGKPTFVFNYNASMIPDLCGSGAALIMKWHLIIIHGKRRNCSGLMILLTVVRTSLNLIYTQANLMPHQCSQGETPEWKETMPIVWRWRETLFTFLIFNRRTSHWWLRIWNQHPSSTQWS